MIPSAGWWCACWKRLTARVVKRAIPPIDGPRRESRPGQTTLDRSHPLRSVGLEESSSRSQRSAGKRPPRVRPDDAVDRQVREPAEGGGPRRPSAGRSGHQPGPGISPARSAGAGATAPRPIRARAHNRLRSPAPPSESAASSLLVCCDCCVRCATSSGCRWPPARRLASARCRWRSPLMPTERVTSFSSMCRDRERRGLGPGRSTTDQAAAASQERRRERYTARASPTPNAMRRRVQRGSAAPMVRNSTPNKNQREAAGAATR